MISRILALFAMAAVLPASARPQGIPEESAGGRGPGRGVWIGAGIGGGLEKVGCDVCLGDWDIAPSAHVRIGGTINRHLGLGLEGNGTLENDAAAGVRDVMVGVGAVLYWYPSPDGPRYYIKGGFGPMFFRAEDSDVPAGEVADPAITSTAFGGHFGIGYEIGGGRVVLVPFLNMSASVFGNLHQGDTRLTNAALTLIQFGLGVRWR